MSSYDNQNVGYEINWWNFFSDESKTASNVQIFSTTLGQLEENFKIIHCPKAVDIVELQSDGTKIVSQSNITITIPSIIVDTYDKLPIL